MPICLKAVEALPLWFGEYFSFFDVKHMLHDYDSRWQWQYIVNQNI
jgi:hypothetical protein